MGLVRVNPPSKIKPDPKAWTRKYLIADSVLWASFFIIIRGKKDIRFNSRPSQTVNQLLADREIPVPAAIVT